MAGRAIWRMKMTTTTMKVQTVTMMWIWIRFRRKYLRRAAFVYWIPCTESGIEILDNALGYYPVCMYYGLLGFCSREE